MRGNGLFMKIILSRKGFDSESGGYPSPILPNGRMISLPIPDSKAPAVYDGLKLNSTTTYFDLMKSLNPKIHSTNEWEELTKETKCHLDPDIYTNVLKRDDGWKGLFGQVSGAQTHLKNQGVKEDDIFLFFGWFRKTIYKDDKLIYDPEDKHGRHIIFGYLQIGEIKKVDQDAVVPKWIEYHPHNIVSRGTVENTIYVARDTVDWNDNIMGYGAFDYNKQLVLSKEGHTRSCWDLPDIFRNVYISYHTENSWKEDYFESAGRGQEFVVDANEDVVNWAKNLIRNYSR